MTSSVIFSFVAYVNVVFEVPDPAEQLKNLEFELQGLLFDHAAAVGVGGQKYHDCHEQRAEDKNKPNFRKCKDKVP